MKEIQTEELCEYGCGHIAKYELANGKKCCSKSANSCKANKAKNASSKTVDKVCPHCHTEFKQINSRVFANHVRWCKENPKHDKCCGKNFKEKLSATCKENSIIKHGQLKMFDVECNTCHTHFQVQEFEKDFPSKERYFCSRSCANSYSAKHVDHKNISVGVKRYYQEHSMTLTQKEVRKCKWCDSEFETTNKRDAQCCSPSCAAKYREFILFQSKIKCAKTEYEQLKLFLKKYRQACSFTFSIKLFPDEFDFSLIEQYGWYAAKNRGNNLNGVSRDHMFSVKDGFINYIDPIFLAHPANCRLIRHNENISKLDKSLFSKTELLSRIIEWDNKYGKYNVNMNYNNFDLIYDWKKQFTII